MVCGPDCQYRRLYEGSQDSLTAMASTQTATLRRVSQLRAGILGVLKQVFPGDFAAAEARLGSRLESVDDAVLLTFLEGFVRSGARPLNAFGAAQPAPLAPGTAPAAASATPPAPAAPTTPRPEVTPPVSRVGGPARPAPAQEHMAGFATPGPEERPWPTEEPDDVPPDLAWDLSHLFDDPAGTGPAPAEESAEGLFDRLYEQAPAPSDTVQATAVRETTPVPAGPESEPASVGAGAITVPVQDDPGVPPPAVVADEPAQEPASEEPAAAARTADAVLKPQMFPAGQVPRPGRAKKAAGRTPRVSATAPTAEAPAVATDRFAELLDIVTGPRPVFMSDLVSASGSPGLVSAWEQHFKEQGVSAPVRIITPRSHHRDRGALVLPHSDELREKAASAGRTCWSECLEDGPGRARLRGARLYEVAVLLHRFADQIVSYKLTPDVLSMRLNAATGLTGVVMWVGSEAPSGTGREHLTHAVGEMIGDRLELLAVLTYESGDRALDRLAGLVAEDAAAQGWRPTMQVVASHSWDFAQNGGAAALAVL